MAGLSNYPAVPDLDADLIRVNAADAVVPSHHNGLLDAVQSIEQTVGYARDGSEGGGSPAFNCGITDYVGMLDVSWRHPRLPWYPRHANSFYADARALPSGATLGANTTISYDNPPGMAFLKTTANSENVLTLPLPAEASWYAILRFKHSFYAQRQDAFRIGFSKIGDGSDIEGVTMNSLNYRYNAFKSLSYTGTNGTFQTATISNFCYLYLWNSGGAGNWAVSSDGVFWDSNASANLNTQGDATAFVMRKTAITEVGFLMWLDFVAFGTTAPTLYQAA